LSSSVPPSSEKAEITQFGTGYTSSMVWCLDAFALQNDVTNRLLPT
jgi:hypothetical protein